MLKYATKEKNPKRDVLYSCSQYKRWNLQIIRHPAGGIMSTIYDWMVGLFQRENEK